MKTNSLNSRNWIQEIWFAVTNTRIPKYMIWNSVLDDEVVGYGPSSEGKLSLTRFAPDLF